MNNEQKVQLTATLVGRAWSGFAFFALMLLFVSLYTLLFALIQFVGLSESQQMIYQTFAFHWAGLLFIAGNVRLRKMNWAVLYGMNGNLLVYLRPAVKYYFGMIAVVLVGAFAWTHLLERFGVEPSVQKVVDIILNAEPFALKVYLVFLAVVLAPVFEEFLFRGVLFPMLARWMPLKTAAVLVSVCFALLHAHVPAFLPLMLVSLCLCYAYWWTGSLWVNIGMHMLFNGINLLCMFQFAS